MSAIVKDLVLKTPLVPFRRFRRALRVRPRRDLVRLGSDYGGWTVPADLVESSWTCYSGGVGNDTTFDLAFIERFGCEVDAFDPRRAPSSTFASRPPPSRDFTFILGEYGPKMPPCGSTHRTTPTRIFPP